MKRICAILLAAALLLSMTACGSTTPEATDSVVETTAATAAATEPAAPVDLQALYDTMAGHMPEMIVLNETMMLNFCGIAAEDCAQAVVAVSDDGLRTDEVWLIEAVDEAALSRLQELAENRLKAKGEESISYSPEQYAVVEKAEVITSGLYLAVIVSPDVDTLADICRGAI